MWWIWFTFQVKTGDDIPMPAYFRFLALLAFKIFSDEQVNTFRILIVRQAFTLVMNLDKYMFEPFLICEFWRLSHLKARYCGHWLIVYQIICTFMKENVFIVCKKAASTHLHIIFIFTRTVCSLCYWRVSYDW